MNPSQSSALPLPPTLAWSPPSPPSSPPSSYSTWGGGAVHLQACPHTPHLITLLNLHISQQPAPQSPRGNTHPGCIPSHALTVSPPILQLETQPSLPFLYSATITSPAPPIIHDVCARACRSISHALARDWSQPIRIIIFARFQHSERSTAHTRLQPVNVYMTHWHAGALSLRIFVSPLALASSCSCHDPATAATSSDEFFEALAAPFCLSNGSPSLLPKRQALSWPNDAVTAAAAGVAAATSEFSIKDESWLPLGFAAVLITVNEETTLQKILSFFRADVLENVARFVAGKCGDANAPNDIRIGEQFLVFENGIAFDDDFGTLHALGALLKLPKQDMKHWHEPVYNNSVCVICVHCTQRTQLLSSCNTTSTSTATTITTHAHTPLHRPTV